MPLYNTLNPPPFIAIGYPLNRYSVFVAETLLVDTFSQQIGVPLGPVAGQKGVRVELDFNQNPGTFEIDIMESSSDELTARNYQQVPTAGAITTVTTGKNGASTHQGVDLIPFAGEFLCLYIKTAPSNAGTTCTVRILRIA